MGSQGEVLKHSACLSWQKGGGCQKDVLSLRFRVFVLSAWSWTHRSPPSFAVSCFQVCHGNSLLFGVMVVSWKMLPGISFHGSMWCEGALVDGGTRCCLHRPPWHVTDPADSRASVWHAPVLQCLGDQKQPILPHESPFLKNSCCSWISGAGHLDSSA